jgi:hypothetical protein
LEIELSVPCPKWKIFQCFGFYFGSGASILLYLEAGPDHTKRRNFTLFS